MPERPGHSSLRVVGPAEPAGPGRRGPGIAVIAVVVYGLLFLAALWGFRGKAKIRSPESKVADDPVATAGRAGAFSRAALLAGTVLPPLAREEYLGQLVTDCCDCGCDLTLRRCLVSDRSCTRSPQLAKERLRRAASPPELAASAP